MFNEEEKENLELDCEKFAVAIRKLYGVENIVILARKGDALATMGGEKDSVCRAIIRVADKFHNEGVKSF